MKKPLERLRSWFPLPLKAFLSYVAVVSAGALPLAYYLVRYLEADQTAQWVFRVSLAAALSVSLLMSLVSVVVFARPLRRVADLGEALADGEMPPRFPAASPGDLSRIVHALQRMAAAQRKQQAQIEAGRSMLEQMIEAVSLPLALVDPRGRVIAINDAARDQLSSTTAQVDGHLRLLINSPNYVAAVRDAEALCEPVAVAWSTAEGEDLRGFLHALRQPDSPSFVLFLSRDAVRKVQGSMMPPPSAVQSLPLADWLQGSIARAMPALLREGIELTHDDIDTQRDVQVADVQERGSFALSMLLEGAVMAARESSKKVELVIEPRELQVVLTVLGNVGKASASVARSLLKPLGTQLKLRDNDCVLRIPRA